MISKEQLTTMLVLQDKLNTTINPKWRTANYPWHRAIMVEAIEALEHYGWKWWKKQDPDLGQARIELVDIWHFILSNQVTECSGETEWAAESLMSRIKLAHAQPHSVLMKLDLLIGSAAGAQINFDAFVGLMRDFDLSWQQLYTTYIGKNVLNLFRQAHGYKEGTYIKTWDGREDNHCLDILMKGKPDATPEQLYAKLEQIYATVTAATGVAA